MSGDLHAAHSVTFGAMWKLHNCGYFELDCFQTM